MASYQSKKLDYGYKEKVFVYSNPIRYGNKNPAPVNGRQKYTDMPKFRKMASDERRIRYYKKQVAELVETALMNLDLSTAITLTFRRPVTSYSYALEEWKLFLKRLRHYYPDFPLKYICVWEYQKERGKKRRDLGRRRLPFPCIVKHRVFRAFTA